ncbi:MAG: type II toxin-antitoxin system HicA family toxin [Desulfococcaceae bacterium]
MHPGPSGTGTSADHRNPPSGSRRMMPPPLPVLSGGEVVRIFESFGWEVVRRKGSHIIMIRDEGTTTLSAPDHREVAKGTLRGLIRAAGLTVGEFVTKM